MPNHTHADQAQRLLDTLVQDLGVDADLVPHSPVHAINIWTPDNPRNPTITVVVDADGYTWGHSYEHNLGPDTDTTEVARRLAEAAAYALPEGPQ